MNTENEKSADRGESNSTDLLCEVDSVLMKRVYFALETGRDNAVEVYNQHINKIVSTKASRQDLYLGKLFKNDIKEVEKLIEQLNDKWHFGV